MTVARVLTPVWTWFFQVLTPMLTRRGGEVHERSWKGCTDPAEIATALPALSMPFMPVSPPITHASARRGVTVLASAYCHTPDEAKLPTRHSKKVCHVQLRFIHSLSYILSIRNMGTSISRAVSPDSLPKALFCTDYHGSTIGNEQPFHLPG